MDPFLTPPEVFVKNYLTSYQQCQSAMWAEASALDPGDNPALRSLHEEAVEELASGDRSRRFIATATA